MNSLYTTAQASEITGIPASTIRSWLSRYSELFKLGVHVVKDDNGRNMWTDAGIELLQQRQSGDATKNATAADAFFNPEIDAITKQLLEIAADVRARYILQHLPLATLNRLRELINTDPQVQESLQHTIYSLTRYQLSPGATVDATTEN